MSPYNLRLPNSVEECHDVIKELHAIVRQLFERVEKLEKENRELQTRLDNDSNNSSKPPSSDFKKKKSKKQSSGRTSGGQKGHPGHFRLLESFSSLWMFFHEDDVEPTNNHAERCLRYLVIWRKKYFATQSNYGSEYVAHTASLITTAKLQKTNPFHYLSEAIERSFSGKSIIPIIKEVSS